MSTAMMLATVPSHAARGEASPAATLRFGDATVLDRLCGQLSGLGVRRARVLTRPQGAGAVGRTGCVRGYDAELVESQESADDLRRIARAAREAAAGRESVIVLPAELVAHREALAGLLADPRVTTGALVTTNVPPDAAATVAAGPPGESTPVRVEHQRLVSAGSSYHRVSGPNAGFLGVLRVGPGDAEVFADVADRLAPFAERGGLDDVPALLLVGLVRAGVYVGASDVRELRCLRVTDTAGAGAAEAALREVDEDQVLLDSAVKADDGLFTTYCVSPYSKHVARWAARQGLSPNTVSAISLGLGVAAAACFALGSRLAMVAGAVVLLVSFGADCVDGQLARYTRTFSALGGWLDATFDRAKEYVAYAGLAVGAAASGAGGVWSLAVAALVLQTARHMIDFGYAGARPQAGVGLSWRPLDEPDDGRAGHFTPARRASGGAFSASSTKASRARQLPGRLGVAATALSRRLEGRKATRWLKKVIVLPIGERFALIAVTAALGGARVTFVALLAWGGLAGVYTLTGRVLRSLTRTREAPSMGRAASASHTLLYRDDGPFARLVGYSGVVGLVDQSWRGRSVPLGATLVATAGTLATLAQPRTWPVVVGAVWCVLAAGAVSGHPHPGRLDWLGPPLLRVVEYTFVGVLGLVGGAPPAVVFALLGAVAYHHYDTAYRVRQRSRPPEWLSQVSLGWDGRMLVAALAAAAGVVTPVYVALMVALWVVFATESVMSWLVSPAPQAHPATPEDSDREGERR